MGYSYSLPLVLVIGQPPRAAMAASEVSDVVAGHADVISGRGPAEVAALVREDGRDVAVVVIVASDLDVDETLEELTRLHAFDIDDVRIVVVSWNAEHRDMSRAVDSGRLHALVANPTEGIVGFMVASEVRGWLMDHAHEALTLPAEPNAPGGQSAFLETLNSSDEVLVSRLMAWIERALGPRAVLYLEEGTRLTRQGYPMEGVYVVLRGGVALTRQAGSEKLLLHHASTGPMVGLVSLTSGREAHFTATATTDSEVVHLSIEQLDRALRLAPQMGVVLAALSMRSLTARLMRSEELQFERNELNRQLEAERARLTETLRALEEARLELVSQARFATLGELSAGVAHELNNPVAAIKGVAGHIPSDLSSLLTGHPQEGLLREILDAVASRSSVPTSVQRAARREVEAATGDPEFAWGIVGAGVADPELAIRAHGSIPKSAMGAAGLAGAARNIEVATTRISELVHSLRSYSRPESELEEHVDINVTIDDTLHLLSHRLHEVEVVREFGTLPEITARPSQLGQVWTNIVVNAVDALDGPGRIEITTSTLDSDSVRVVIRDNGPGIPPDVLPRIFEPRFSTKKGTVRYGLGLGMGISRRIVEEHGGTLTAESEPGCTEMTVTLPMAGPNKEEE
ncbi:MAG: ATP-binding protein [bacterium]|nr:ATP-binding protein [bacterium]